MILVIQRVKSSSVKVNEKIVSKIKIGLLVFAAIEEDDTENEVNWCAEKVSLLRIFPDKEGKMNLSVKDVGGEILIVSQFTLCGELKKGSRPSFSKAAKPEKAKPLFDLFVEKVKEKGVNIQTGVFQAMMDVELINDGPVTIILKKKHKENG